MKDRVAIVTGSARGIGKAIALELASKGAKVVINYAGSKDAALETAKLCQEKGAETLVIQGDVSKAEDCERIVKKTLESFGKIDILVNNAGITRDNLIMRMSEDDFDAVINTNLKSVYLMSKAVARPMMKNRYGRIVNVSSVVGIMGNAGQVNYSASKAGVLGITKSLAREMATRNITVNAVAPGFIQTDMTEVLSDEAKNSIAGTIPAGKLGTAEDVAHAAAFFASDKARYVTGQAVCVDGGMCMY